MFAISNPKVAFCLFLQAKRSAALFSISARLSKSERILIWLLLEAE